MLKLIHSEKISILTAKFKIIKEDCAKEISCIMSKFGKELNMQRENGLRLEEVLILERVI
jgi:hypothetical protein